MPLWIHVSRSLGRRKMRHARLLAGAQTSAFLGTMHAAGSGTLHVFQKALADVGQVPKIALASHRVT